MTYYVRIKYICYEIYMWCMQYCGNCYKMRNLFLKMRNLFPTRTPTKNTYKEHLRKKPLWSIMFRLICTQKIYITYNLCVKDGPGFRGGANLFSKNPGSRTTLRYTIYHIRQIDNPLIDMQFGLVRSALIDTIAYLICWGPYNITFVFRF